MHRYAYLANDLSLDNSGEKTIDVKIQDPITALWLEMRCNNGTEYNHHSPMHLCVDAVELIDGSTVLWSLDGAEMLGMVCAQLGFMPTQKFIDTPNSTQIMQLPILFGNFLGDTVRSFDPTRFLNPQFRVKWNLANVTTVGNQGYLDGGLTMTLIAEIMEDAPKPRSMLMAKEVYSYTAAAATEYRDLRRDYAYKALMIRAVATDSHWYDVISNLKLDLEGGRKVPFDIATEDLNYLLMLKQPRLEYRHMFHPSSGVTIYPILKEKENLQLMNEELYDFTLGYVNYEYGQGTMGCYSSGTPVTTFYNQGADVSGYCPFHCVYIPFGDPLKPETWFNAPAWQSIQLELTGLLEKAVYICLLQDRVY